MANKAVEHQLALEKLATLIGKEQDCAAIIAPDDTNWVRELEDQKKKSGGKFMVLIVGIFSTGKSSMINALIGEKLLPSGLLPETGVLTELHYGADKRITVYPKPGRHDSDEPFTLPEANMAEIRKYVSLNSKDQKTGAKNVESPFEKMVIEWPLEILKEGIVLVDTVGLNDPYGNGAITEQYLPEADAILYLLTCSNPPCTELDRKELETLRGFGFKNIMFTYTHYDTALAAYEDDEDGLDAMKAANAEFCLEHTDLGEESIHYVNSLEGLAGVLEDNAEKRLRSGYVDLEKFLETYLVENKGREQIDVLTRVMQAKRDDMARSAAAQDAAARGDRQAALDKAERARKELESIRTRSEQAGRTFRTLMESGVSRITDMVTQQVSTVADRVSITGYEVQTRLPTGFGRLNPLDQRRKVDALMKECAHAFNEEINKANTQWGQSTLQNAFMDLIAESTKCIEQDIRDIAVDLQGIEETLTGTNQDGKKPSRLGYDIGNGALSVLLSLLNPVLGGASALFGAKKAFGGFAAGFGILYAVILAGGPATIPMGIIAMLAGEIIVVLTGGNKGMIASIKKKIEKQMRKSYNDPKNQQANIDAMSNKVREVIDGICKAMDDALQQDIDAHEKLIGQTVAAAEDSAEGKAEGIARRARAIQDLDGIMDAVNAARADYGLEAL